MDFFGNDGLSRIRRTLPSVVSAVCIAQHKYLADSLLSYCQGYKEACPKILINKSEIKPFKVHLNVPWTAMELARIHKFQHPKSGSP